MRAAGSQAVPAWQFRASGGQADQASMMVAFARSGAVLLARFMGFSTQIVGLLQSGGLVLALSVPPP